MTAIPEAYEPASFAKAWDLTLKHFLTFLLVSVAAIVIGGIGFLVVFFLGSIVTFVLQGFSFSSQDSTTSSMALLIGQMIGWVVSLPFSVIGQLLVVLLSAIPAVYFTTGEKIAPGTAFQLLLARPWRYIFAGIVFSVAVFVGFFLCVLPSFAVGFVGPVYMNKVFTTDIGVFDAFSSSFSDVYKSDQCWPFIGIQVVVAMIASLPYLCCVFPASMANAVLPLIALPAYIVSILIVCCLVIPASSFYLQNVAYRRGLLS